MDVQFRWHAISDIGGFRFRNEDSWGVLQAKSFFVIADGMGGHPGGDIAASQAVHYLCRQIRKRSHRSIHQFFQLLQETNDHLFTMSLDEDLLGMGTTLCFAQITQGELVYGHVGDSRVYHHRQGKCKQLTKDHSLLSELIDSGKISTEESHQFDKKNILTQAIGTKEMITPEVARCAVEPGDKILLCSDGLHDALTIKQIERILNINGSEKETAQWLVEAAKKAKTKDNITAIVIQVHEHLSR